MTLLAFGGGQREVAAFFRLPKRNVPVLLQIRSFSFGFSLSLLLILKRLRLLLKCFVYFKELEECLILGSPLDVESQRQDVPRVSADAPIVLRHIVEKSVFVA